MGRAFGNPGGAKPEFAPARKKGAKGLMTGYEA
jgi:hypothetical protein